MLEVLFVFVHIGGAHVAYNLGGDSYKLISSSETSVIVHTR